MYCHPEEHLDEGIQQALREALGFVSLSQVTNGRQAIKTDDFICFIELKWLERLKETERLRGESV